ncbi:MAG: hypothetical protein KDN05_04365, partial [Verrucomicrobiae bacterium]|nr:hypothetical protein [Verrucomicrobiae bacterium]
HDLIRFLNGASNDDSVVIGPGLRLAIEHLKRVFTSPPHQASEIENKRANDFLELHAESNPVPRPIPPCSIVDALQFALKDKSPPLAAIFHAFDEFLLACPTPYDRSHLESQTAALKDQIQVEEEALNWTDRFRPTTTDEDIETTNQTRTSLAHLREQLKVIEDIREFRDSYKPGNTPPIGAIANRNILRELVFHSELLKDTSIDPEEDQRSNRCAESVVFATNILSIFWLVSDFPDFWNKHKKYFLRETLSVSPELSKKRKAAAKLGTEKKEIKSWMDRTDKLIAHLNKSSSSRRLASDLNATLTEFATSIAKDARTQEKITEFYQTIIRTGRFSRSSNTTKNENVRFENKYLEQKARTKAFRENVIAPCRELLAKAGIIEIELP